MTHAAYRAAFDAAPALTPVAPPPAGERASHCVFAVVLGEEIDRAAFRGHLSARGVETSIHFPPLHSSPAYDAPATALPLTEAFAARAVSLPIFPHMEAWQRTLVIEAALEAAAAGEEPAATAADEPRSASAVAGA